MFIVTFSSTSNGSISCTPFLSSSLFSSLLSLLPLPRFPFPILLFSPFISPFFFFLLCSPLLSTPLHSTLLSLLSSPLLSPPLPSSPLLSSPLPSSPLLSSQQEYWNHTQSTMLPEEMQDQTGLQLERTLEQYVHVLVEITHSIWLLRALVTTCTK